VKHINTLYRQDAELLNVTVVVHMVTIGLRWLYNCGFQGLTVSRVEAVLMFLCVLLSPS